MRAAASPTAPVVPVMRTVSPSLREATSMITCHAVRYGIPTVAACSNVSARGFGWTASAGTSTYSASSRVPRGKREHLRPPRRGLRRFREEVRRQVQPYAIHAPRERAELVLIL